MYFEYKQDERFLRPVIRLDEMGGIRVMIDSGALFSVWTFDEERLVKLGGINQHHVVPFGGYGGHTKGNLYTLDVWLTKSILLKNLPVVAEQGLDLNCHLVMSIRALDEFRYIGCRKTRTFGIETLSNQVAYPFAYKIKPSGSISVYMQDAE